mmetsp:Transcript_114383/g.277780  ORF Transcript_114383/g.277780 Transcript_114383/m.277780 type:complete len:206 (-) Transcript_114383:87-704(-)
MARHIWALAAALLSIRGPWAVGASDVVELTDDNFEHDTQAASGATTGDWFVKFYAPWCGHCKSIAPTWEEVATELKGQVNVAKVDATVHQKLAKRFKIGSYPTLIFFSHQKMYKHSGGRDKDALISYASGGFKADEAGPNTRSVPKVPSWLDEALEPLVEDVKHILLMRKNAAVALVVIGALFGALFARLLCPRRVLVEGGKKAK